MVDRESTIEQDVIGKSKWIVVFDGDDREWDGWSEQFLAKA